jgi:hypothetical protein
VIPTLHQTLMALSITPGLALAVVVSRKGVPGVAAWVARGTRNRSTPDGVDRWIAVREEAA